MAQGVRQRGLLQWMRDQVQPVPLEMALCEFDCRKTTCRNADWHTCRRRIEYTASGRHGYPTGLFMANRSHWPSAAPRDSYPKLPLPVYASILS